MNENEDRKDTMTIREQIEWLLDKIGKEPDAAHRMKIVLALVNKVYAGERF